MSKKKPTNIVSILADAVREEHPPDSCAANCEIAVALRNNLPLLAASFLVQATEAPVTLKAIEGYQSRYSPTTFNDRVDKETSALNQIPNWKCLHCHAQNYEDQGSVSHCGACGKAKPAQLKRFAIELFVPTTREKWEVEEALEVLESKLYPAQARAVEETTVFAQDHQLEHLVKAP